MATDDATGLADDFTISLTIGLTAKLARAFAGSNPLTIILATYLTKCLATYLAAHCAFRENFQIVSLGSKVVMKIGKHPHEEIVTRDRSHFREVCDRQAVHGENMDWPLVPKVGVQQGHRVGKPNGVSEARIDLNGPLKLVLEQGDSVLVRGKRERGIGFDANFTLTLAGDGLQRRLAVLFAGALARGLASGYAPISP